MSKRGGPGDEAGRSKEKTQHLERIAELIADRHRGLDATVCPDLGNPHPGTAAGEEIVSARATFAGSTAEVKPADMELAQNLPGVLHAWFGRAEERMPQAVMTYTLVDGSEVVVAADEGVICFDGRYRCPKGSSGKLFYHMVQDFVEGRD